MIADVSDINPNVFYELAIRNAVKKPVIVIKAQSQKLPFDIYDKRAITIDMKEARLWTSGKEHLKQQVLESEKDPEQASKSILSEFSFQIDAEKKISPDRELALQLRDMKAEIRQLNEQIHNQKHLVLEDYYEPVIAGNDTRTSSEVRKMQLFVNILRDLEGKNRNPVPQEKLFSRLNRDGGLSVNESIVLTRKMLREASVYESKPSHYNLV